DGRCARDGFEICLGRSNQSLFLPERHAFSSVGSHFPTAEHRDRGCAGMQRHSIELGALHHQHPGRQFILKDPVAAFSAGRFCHSACHFAKRISDSCNRASLRECRPSNDSQRHPPARRPLLFRAFADSTFSSVVVAAQGRRPGPTTGAALSFTVSLVASLLSFSTLCKFFGTSLSDFRRNAQKNEFSMSLTYSFDQFRQ